MYPTKSEIEKASRKQISSWLKFCGKPKTSEEIELYNLMVRRFESLGSKLDPKHDKRG